MEHLDKKLAELEALLFIHGEPLSRKKLCALLQVSGDELTELLTAYSERLKDQSRGLALLLSGERVQLVTKPAYGEMLKGFLKEELKEELTPAALEALSIIAYLGPIPRSRIEYLRGVNSSFTLRNLLLRGLVEREANPERGAGSFVYQVSMDCLRALGLASQEELPEFARFREIVAQSEAAEREQERIEGGGAVAPAAGGIREAS
jgi:segregation and condensation protein B